MARVLLRTQAWGVVWDRFGNALPSLTFAVKNTDGSAATHWSAETGGTSSTATLTTDTLGGATLSGADRWIEMGEYDITTNGATYRVTTSVSPSVVTATLESLGAAGDGITDDTAAFQAAAALGAARITGLHSNYLVRGGVITPGQGNYWDLNGITVTLKTGETNAIFWDQANTDGTTLKTGLGVSGGTFVGNGLTGTANNRDACDLWQWDDVVFKDCTFTNFDDAGLQFWNCGRVTVTGCRFHDLCVSGARNAVIFRDFTPDGSAIQADFVCTNNMFYGALPTGAISLIGQHGGGTRALIANNEINHSSTFASISCELASYGGGTGESQWHNIVIANNLINNSNTANTTTGILLMDDGGSPFNDSFKLADVLITGNHITIAGNGTATNAAIQVYASRATISGNYIVASGTLGRCIYIAANPTTAIVQQILIAGNNCQQLNTAATGSIIEVANASHFKISNNLLTSATTGPAALSGCDGIRVNSTCQFWTISDNRIENAANNGINVTAMKDGQILHNVIYNANAVFNVGTSNTNGIAISNTAAPAGALNQVDFNTIYDDRGTHQMKFAVLQTTTGTNPTLRYNVMQGCQAATAITNAIGNFSDVRGNSTDQPNAFPAAPSNPGMPASTVALTSSDPYDAEYYVTGGTATAITFTRSGGSAKTIYTSAGAATNVRVLLKNGDAFIATYTVAPALTKIPVA